MKDVKLSKYQKDIENFALHGNGDALINAYAGSGKSFTLIHLMKILPKESKKIFCAFNRDIVDDIKTKTNDIENLTIKTIHSLGLSIICRNVGDKPNIDSNKYQLYITHNINNLSETYQDLNYNKKSKFKSNIKKIVNLCRVNLCNGRKCIETIAEKYYINLLGDEIECVLKVLQWGKTNITTIDETDMVWLPNVLTFKYPSFDYIFVDEVQDLSIAQQELVKKCYNIKTRYFYSGDKNQCIYAFSGADSDSFDNFSKLPKIHQFTLPICYRCGNVIIDLASQIVDGIKHNDTSDNIGNINYNYQIDNIKDGDVVLCRNNAPLIKLYFSLLEKGQKVFFNGNEITDTLISMVKETDKDNLSLDLKTDGVFTRLYDKAIDIKEYIKQFEKCDEATAIADPQFRDYIDNISTLEIIANGCNNSEELINKIKTIFDNNNQNGIILSTIHKAKGLEWDNVNILCKSIFDNNLKRAKQKWIIEQEKNLKYVAFTRAKHNLNFIEDEEYSKFSNNLSIDDIAKIEYAVDTALGNKKRTNILNKEYANEIVNNYKQIDKEIKTNVIVGLPSTNNIKQKFGDLKTIITKRKIK